MGNFSGAPGPDRSPNHHQILSPHTARQGERLEDKFGEQILLGWGETFLDPLRNPYLGGGGSDMGPNEAPWPLVSTFQM